jgi:hypothetical protein
MIGFVPDNRHRNFSRGPTLERQATGRSVHALRKATLTPGLRLKLWGLSIKPFSIRGNCLLESGKRIQLVAASMKPVSIDARKGDNETCRFMPTSKRNLKWLIKIEPRARLGSWAANPGCDRRPDRRWLNPNAVRSTKPPTPPGHVRAGEGWREGLRHHLTGRRSPSAFGTRR